MRWRAQPAIATELNQSHGSDRLGPLHCRKGHAGAYASAPRARFVVAVLRWHTPAGLLLHGSMATTTQPVIVNKAQLIDALDEAAEIEHGLM